MNDRQLNQLLRQDKALKALFPAVGGMGTMELRNKLQRFENKAARLALRGCNGPEFAEGEREKLEKQILVGLDKLLGFVRKGIPVFLNGDPRGYSLKIDEAWIAEWNRKRSYPQWLHTDFGGYGLLCPELR